jgi:hypothetical protein
MVVTRWAGRVSLRFGFCTVIFGAALAPTACGDDYDSCEATRTCPTTAGKSGSGGASRSTGSGPGGASGHTSGSGGATSGSGGSTNGNGGTTGDDSGADASMGAGGGDGGVSGADAGPDSFDPTVRGVVTSPSGFPAPGVTVAIGSSAAITDSNGAFVIANAPSIYDILLVRSAPPNGKFVEQFVGLTTRRPVVPFAFIGDVQRSATVNGTIEPSDVFPTTASESRMAFHPSLEPPEESEPFGTTQFGPFTFRWAGGLTITGQLYALQWTIASSGLPTYHRWGTQAIALSDQATISTTLRLNAATQQDIVGTVRAPVPIDSAHTSLWVGALQVTTAGFRAQPSATAVPYRFSVPTGLGIIPKVVTFRSVMQGGTSTTRAELKDAVTALDVDLSAPPVSTLPIEAATGVDVNTEFAWSAVPNAVYTVDVDGGLTVFRINTATTTAKVPDTSTKGVPFAAGAYRWKVYARGPASTIDELVNAMALEKQNPSFSNESSQRSFTSRGP